MIETCAVVAAQVLKMPVSEVKMYARSDEAGKFVFFWNPANKGGIVIVSAKDKSYLSANGNVSYAALLQAYNKGYRS